MARALAVRALDGGNAVEVIGRDPVKSAGLADALGSGATSGTFGARPAGDIVILAVPYAGAASVVRHYGDALGGKVVVDITNPFNDDFSGLLTPHDSSAAQEIAEAAPASAHVVKAFNTVFGTVLATRRPLDVFLAGDDAHAKAQVSEVVESAGMRPLDVGPLRAARRLEEAGLLMMGLAQHGVHHFDFSLGITVSN